MAKRGGVGANFKARDRGLSLGTEMRSSASTFSRRGDPWSTDKEGRNNYERNLDTENADMDMYTRANKPAKTFIDRPGGLHADMQPTKAPARPAVKMTAERKMAQIMQRLHGKMRGKT